MLVGMEIPRSGGGSRRNCIAIAPHSSVQFSSVQGGIYALGKARNVRSTPSLRRLPNVAFETVPMFVLADDGPLASFQGRSSGASCFQRHTVTTRIISALRLEAVYAA